MVWKVWIVRSVAYLLYVAGVLSLLALLVMTVLNFKQLDWLGTLRNAAGIVAIFLAAILLDLLADIGKSVGRLYQEETI
jgi:hypothetical protein